MNAREQALINSTIAGLQDLHVSQGFVFALCKALMSHYMLNFGAVEGENRLDIFRENVKSEVAALRVSAMTINQP